jgi:alpha,alpha-trehalose phosphorylase
MIRHRAFGIDAWSLREDRLDLDVLAQSESIFALGNGHLGLRGNLDEGEPTGVPGTYLDGFYELRPLPYAEAGYGYPESGQTVVNVTDGKLIRLTVGDELFDVRYGRLRIHKRTLDLRAGTLTRRVEWVAPTGAAVRITSQRLVSFAQRGVAAILYTVEPLEQPTRLVVQSELMANQPQPERSADPRAAAALRAPLVSELAVSRETTVLLGHRVAASGLRMAAAMAHVIEGPENTTHEVYAADDVGGVTIAADVGTGERLSVVKLLAYGWSGRRSSDSVRAQVHGALA